MNDKPELTTSMWPLGKSKFVAPYRMNTKIEVKSPSHTYSPVGQCIYCGTRASKLKEEHIIPLSLGGNLVLPASSCVDCESITGRFEQEIARHFIWPFRTGMGFPSRKKKNPEDFEIDFILEDDSCERVRIERRLYPTELYLHKFTTCGFLAGKSDEEKTDSIAVVGWRNGPAFEEVKRVLFSFALDVERRTKKRVKAVAPARYFYPAPFAQMLAKISHSYAVAELGAISFRPILLDIISTDVRQKRESQAAKDISHFVGGSIEAFPHHDDLLHSVDIELVDVGGRTYVVVQLWLFAIVGGAKYHAVVGEALDKAVEQVRSNLPGSYARSIKVSLKSP
ncbi:hypothetical protein GGD66_007784 [Bradyrhizobium sp. CIR48]|uniref:HNH endonuclease n=1 Tax=Bradyrhizobium sp. CIR48 TaxID=2663840 RepID=UPI0016069B99|nr:HNH endonuclease [Bradyrhizobium sp. CIR48]MBB4429184.1 hypothetical protein [Bradyrhizobium sp. CIR48]